MMRVHVFLPQIAEREDRGREPWTVLVRSAAYKFNGEALQGPPECYADPPNGEKAFQFIVEFSEPASIARFVEDLHGRLRGGQDVGMGMPFTIRVDGGIGDKAFDEAYARLSAQGKCDAPFGMEYRRVYREWVEAGRSQDMDELIIQRAKWVPGGYAS